MLGLTLEGLGRYTYEMINGWLQHDPNIKWSLLFDRPTDDFNDASVEKHVLPPATSHVLSIAYWNEGPVTRWLNKHKPDIYISPDGFIPLRSNVRCVPVVHDIAPLIHPSFMRWRDYIYYRLFQVRMIKKAWMISTVSEFSKNEIVSYSQIKRDKVFVIYSGLRANFRRGERRPIDKQALGIERPYFIYYGSIHPRKNVSGTIKSFEAYRSLGGQYDLVLAGRLAWKSDEIVHQIENSEFTDHIHHVSYPDDNTLYELMSDAQGTVFISHYEGFGQPVLESMALGIPVVTSSNSPMEEIGGNAVVTHPPLDHQTVAETLLRLEKDPLYRASLVNKGLVQARKFTYFNESMLFLKKLKESYS